MCRLLKYYEWTIKMVSYLAMSQGGSEEPRLNSLLVATLCSTVSPLFSLQIHRIFTTSTDIGSRKRHNSTLQNRSRSQWIKILEFSMTISRFILQRQLRSKNMQDASILAFYYHVRPHVVHSIPLLMTRPKNQKRKWRFSRLEVTMCWSRFHAAATAQSPCISAPPAKPNISLRKKLFDNFVCD
jgi:hypothetical protein